jgi:hypothetical protein
MSKFLKLILLALFISVSTIGCKDNNNNNNGNITPIDPAIQIMNNWKVPSDFKFNWRIPNIDGMKKAPIIIGIDCSIGGFSYFIKSDGPFYEQDGKRLLENYVFKKDGNMYIWKDWGAFKNGFNDGRYLNCEDGWNEIHNAMSLDDFDLIIVFINEETREVYGRSEILHKSNIKV